MTTRTILKYVFIFLIIGFRLYAQNPIKPDMIKVEGGTFNMGSNNEDDFARPVHSVTVSSFNMAKYLTTVGEYKAFCDATHHPMPEAPKWGWYENSPIIGVSYDDALAYCEWLSETHKVHYRLPTEAEWEYAARGGNKSHGYTYAGGNDMDELGWYAGNAKGQINLVGQKKPNELGLYDMSGNVWEWCLDWYAVYSPIPAYNPKGPETGTNRVLRGGGWINAASGCNVAKRYFRPPTEHYLYEGFRVVSTE